MNTPPSIAADLIARLRSLRDERNIAGQRHFGIQTATEQLGVPMGALRALGRAHRRDHDLALALWETGVHEARILAAIIDDPAQLTSRQMDRWARDADNWALTDTLCLGLFCRSAFAVEKAHAWSGRRAEFVKRAAFSLMAGLAVHRKELPDQVFLELLPLIERASDDDRNFVKKAVNWALRQIGKRNARLRRAAITTAERIRRRDSRAARWIAADALRELRRGG